MYNMRTLKGRREKISSGEKLDTMIMMEPSDFFYTKNQQETMTLPQLGEFIGKQKMRGAPNVNTFEVEYHKRFAMPFAAFILTVIGVSLSSQKRKGRHGNLPGHRVGFELRLHHVPNRLCHFLNECRDARRSGRLDSQCRVCRHCLYSLQADARVTSLFLPHAGIRS